MPSIHGVFSFGRMLIGQDMAPIRAHPRWPELLRRHSLQDQPIAKLR